MTKRTKLIMDPIRSMWYTRKSQYFWRKRSRLVYDSSTYWAKLHIH